MVKTEYIFSNQITHYDSFEELIASFHETSSLDDSYLAHMGLEFCLDLVTNSPNHMVSGHVIFREGDKDKQHDSDLFFSSNFAFFEKQLSDLKRGKYHILDLSKLNSYDISELKKMKEAESNRYTSLLESKLR